jgi:PAS domain-containing protein
MGKLLVAQQTTEATIDSLFDPVIVADATGRVTRVNPAAERLFGVQADTIGKTDRAGDARCAHRAVGRGRPSGAGARRVGRCGGGAAVGG